MKTSTQWSAAALGKALLLTLTATLVGLLPAHPAIAAMAPAAEMRIAQPPPACADWRWIGLRAHPGLPCPSAGGFWQVTPLFSPPPGGALAPALAPFCLYEHPREGDSTSVPTLVATGALLRADRDCAGIGGAGNPGGGPLAAALWQPLAEHFRAQAGAVPLLDGFPTPAVRLGVLDTSPSRDDGLLGSAVSPHGLTMARLAQELVCDEVGNCAARVTTRLALAWLIFDAGDALASARSEVRGGFFGLLGDLARAVDAEVQAWEGDVAGPEHLVLNLSVGWDGRRLGGSETEVAAMPVPVQAVYRALEGAHCRGALIVAAAGNRGGGPDAGSGMILPAAWSLRPSPGLAACTRALGESPPLTFPLDGEEAGALLYAASGVDATGSPLANARPLSRSPWAAFAAGATAESMIDGRVSGQPTGVYTGSSVAAAVVSATAATVWAYRPSLSAWEVMQLLYASGDDLGASADFVPPGFGAPPGSRRIALCQALAAACTQEGAAWCPQGPPSCPPWDREPPLLSPTLDTLPAPELPIVDASALDGVMPLQAPCLATTLLYLDLDGEVVEPCPAEQYQGLSDHPWTGPQPPDAPCPMCVLDPDQGGGAYALSPPEGPAHLADRSGEDCTGAVANPYTLRIEIRGDYPGGPLGDAVLTLGETSYALTGLPPLLPGDRAVVRCIDGDLLSGGAPVSLAFRAGANTGVDNPVLTAR